MLNVNDRAQYNQPSEYKAQLEINFDPEFESVNGDQFETFILPGATVCDPGQVNNNIAYVNGDMGRDGDPADNINDKVARDAYGFSLNYFNGDYKPIQPAVQPFAAGLHNLSPGTDNMITGTELFNGNIASMLVNIPKLGIPGGGNSGTNPMLYGYRYDQLNRIVGMNAYKNDPSNTQPQTFAPLPTDDYRERISYDPNGNILSYHRNGTATPPAQGNGTGGVAMDQLSYKYLYVRTNNTLAEYTPGQPFADPLFDHFTNQLASVQDAIGDDKYSIDIDAQAAFNYEYDKTGNLVKDKKEHITNITWTVYGKIAGIIKDADNDPQTTNDITSIEYGYDASGNRICKTVIPPAPANGKKTIYVRDASGNVMSVYERDVTTPASALRQTEVHLYGSSRIGMATERSVEDMDNIGLDGGFEGGILSSFTRNEKLFELSNHLGNVLVTIADKKKAVDSDADGTIDYYEAHVVSAVDYYPFGMQMPGRKYGDEGRFGFNGKERDKDLHSLTAYDYGFRIYNPAIGKFLSVDPLTKSYSWYTPYQFAGNSPLLNVDLDGKEPLPYTEWKYGGWETYDGFKKIVGDRSFVKVINFGNLYDDGHNYVAIRDQKIEGKWWYGYYDDEVGQIGNRQKGNWHIYNSDKKNYDSWRPEGFSRDDFEIMERAKHLGKFGEVYTNIMINGVIIGVTGGMGSGTSVATRFVLTRIGTAGGDAASQLASGKSWGELNITSIGFSATTGLPAPATAFSSSAYEYSIDDGFENSWDVLGLGGKKTTKQVAIETGVGGALGALGSIGNSNIGVGSKGLYRDLRYSFNPSGAKTGMTVLPAATSFGVNFMGGVVGGAAQTQESQQPAEKKE